MRELRILTTGLQFPEGPIAMPDGSLIVVEIRGQRLTLIEADGSQKTIAQLAGGPNGAAMGPDGKIYVCNNGGYEWARTASGWVPRSPPLDRDPGGAIQRVDVLSGKVETLFTHCGDVPLRAPNDLVFDRQGGLWFTDLGKSRGRVLEHGAVYYMSPGGASLTEMLFPLMSPNGIGLSADESQLYVAEMLPARLWAFDLSAPGIIAPVASPIRGEQGRCIGSAPGYQMFDSLAVEANGNICLATMISGCVTVMSPAGHVVEQIMTDDPGTSNICFGGADLTDAYITLSRRGVVAATEWSRPGLPLNFLNI